MKKILLVAALATVICTTPAWSQGRSGGRGGQGMGMGMMSSPAMSVKIPQANMIDRLADSLQLTDDQKTQLKSIITKGTETLNTLTKKSTASSKVLREAILATSYDAQKVKDLAATAERDEAAEVSASIDVWTQIRSVLSADQIKQLNDVMGKQGIGRQRTSNQQSGDTNSQSNGEFGPPPSDNGDNPPAAPDGNPPSEPDN